MADPSEAIAPAAEAEVNPASSDGAAPMTLESVLATLASDVAAGSHSAAVLRECYLAQQQVSSAADKVASRDTPCWDSAAGSILQHHPVTDLST